MTSIFLSPDNPRWTPKSEDDIRSVVDGGLLAESSRLDAKKELLSKGDNKELARDLASFAIDGGTLIIGIGEDKERRRFFCEPQKLDGLAEKIDQVARTIPDPPLNVITDEIPATADPMTGYVLVHVPANPQAPHMVDGRYYGRNDKTKHVLTDNDVARLHLRRRVADQDALALVHQEMDNDPLRNLDERSHLFLVAQPMAGRDDMLLKLTSGPGWNTGLNDFLQRAYLPELNSALAGCDISPDLTDATHGCRRAGGAAKATPNLGTGRQYEADSRRLGGGFVIELQVFEDGGLRLFSSRLSDSSDGTADGEQVILDATPVNLTRRFLGLVLAAAEEGGYVGNWAVGIGATMLSGRKPAPARTQWAFGTATRYDRSTYERATGTTWAELNDAPAAIANRLVGPFLRALGTDERFHSFLTDAPEGTR